MEKSNIVMYIIIKPNDENLYLCYAGKGNFVWNERNKMKVSKALKNKRYPSLFECEEDAYSFAYNIAKLHRGDFTVRKTRV